MENEIEEGPESIAHHSDYDLLNGLNTTNRESFLSSTNFLIVSNMSNVSWLYSNFTRRSIYFKRLVHVIFYLIYLATAIVTQMCIPTAPIYSKTPFVMFPMFTKIG